MARNKYQEVTVEKILDVSQRLFLEKGYDATTIQDIVDDLGGLTKGALYHHFRSKEEIMVALSQRMFARNDPFAEVQARKDLNGLQKMRLAVRLNQSDAQQVELNRQAIPLIKNPRVLSQMLETNIKELCPRWQRLIEEGCRDGSIHTEYGKELAELIPLLTSLWLAPTVFPSTAEGMLKKFRFIREMLEKMGMPVIDDEIMKMAEEYFREIEDSMKEAEAFQDAGREPGGR